MHANTQHVGSSPPCFYKPPPLARKCRAQPTQIPAAGCTVYTHQTKPDHTVAFLIRYTGTLGDQLFVCFFPFGQFNLFEMYSILKEPTQIFLPQKHSIYYTTSGCQSLNLSVLLWRAFRRRCSKLERIASFSWPPYVIGFHNVHFQLRSVLT